MAGVAVMAAVTSCSPHRVASWSIRTDEVRTYDEDREQGQVQELLSLDRVRLREETTIRRAKAGLSRRATCPRCYHTVYLTDTARKGDEVRCGSCGMAFGLQ